MRKRCFLLDLGLVEYGEAFRLQQSIAAARGAGSLPDFLLALEHPPVLTLGRRANNSNIIVSEESLRKEGVALFRTTRGGDVTYHGPGQLVVYPILALRALEMGASLYVHTLERVIVDLLQEFGIEARQDPRYIGVWAGEEKIAAIGVAISGGISTHGFALNVDPDLSHFRLINPCGITDRGVTSMAKLMGRRVPLSEVRPRWSHHFANRFGVEVVPCPPSLLASAGIVPPSEIPSRPG